MSVVHYRLLGPVGVWLGDRRIGPATPQLRSVLALLLLDVEQVVPIPALTDALWPSGPPPSARNAVQGYIARLRKLVAASGDDAELARVGAGYRLSVRRDRVDLYQFRDLVQDARSAAPAKAGELLRTALELWSGPALSDVAGDWLPSVVGTALEEERLIAVEHRIAVDLSLDRHHQAVTELGLLVAAHPLRERLVGLLMTALHRCGRTAEGLALFRDTRRRLVDELGMEPGSDLQRAHRQLLDATSGVDVVPRQLPADVRSFAGRHRVLNRLDGMLAMAGRGPAAAMVIITIGGSPGIGKTALAVHWAHRIQDRFPDGQLYVNLRGFDPAGSVVDPQEAVRGFLHALGVSPGRVPAGAQAEVGLYRSLLADKRMLILLDNALDTDHVRPLLPGAPGCLVVVTSRNPLAGLAAEQGSHPLNLDLLTAAESRELLTRRLGKDRLEGRTEAVDEIVAHCHGLPLALAAVAARAATNPTFPLDAIAAELRQRQPGDAATRMRSVFSWSCEKLSAGAARLFRLLALHPGPDFTPAAAASLAGVPLRQVRPLLAEMTAAHLVWEYHPGRYTTHDLLRAYAADLSDAQDGDAERRAALHRLLDHYLHAVHDADLARGTSRDPIAMPPVQTGVHREEFADPAHALAWCTAERRVLLAIVDRAAAAGFDRHAWQLAWILKNFFSRQGHWHDQVATQSIAVDAARRLADRSWQAEAHRYLGGAHDRLGRDADAAAHYRDALDLFAAVGDRTGQAHVHLDHARLLARQGRHQDALDHSRRALAGYRVTGHRVGEARSLGALGWEHAQLGEYAPAMDYCRQALAVHQAAGDVHGEATTWDSIGYIHHQLGDHRRAAESFEHALDLLHETGDRFVRAETLVRLGETRHAAGDHDSARENWREALRTFEELAHPAADQLRARLTALPGG